MPRKKKPTEEYYVKYVEDCWKEGQDAAKPRRKVWEELWQLYQNKQDWSNKQGWQSKAFIPKTFMQVEKASGEVKRAVIQTRKLFKLELDDYKDSQVLAELEEQLRLDTDADGMGDLKLAIEEVKTRIDLRKNRMMIAEKGFKRSLRRTNLTNIYSEMVKVAFLLGLGVPKVLWDEKNDRSKYENVDIVNLSISPDYMPFQEERPKYIVERQEQDLAAFLRKAKRENKKGSSSPWIMKEIKKIEEDAPIDKRMKERQRRGLGDYKPVSKKVELKQFWGDVISEDGKDIEENVLMVVANKKYLVRKQPNPFRHKKLPYILTMPLVFPHRGTDGTSLIAPQVKLQYLLNNIVNMYVDNLNFSINKVYEANPTDFMNPQALTAIYPGKILKKNVDGQSLFEVKTAPVGSDALKAIELIDRFQQEGSNVTEFVSGMPGKKSKTLGEVQLKTAQSRGLFDVIARDLEENSLRPLLEMSYDLYVQFSDYEPREGNYIFSVGGLSLMIMQKELVDRVGQVLTMALQSPVLDKMTDTADLWKKFLSIYNLSDVYVEPETMTEKITPEQQMAVQQKAEADAKREVAGMSEEQIMKVAG